MRARISRNLALIIAAAAGFSVPLHSPGTIYTYNVETTIGSGTFAVDDGNLSLYQDDYVSRTYWAPTGALTLNGVSYSGLLLTVEDYALTDGFGIDSPPESERGVSMSVFGPDYVDIVSGTDVTSLLAAFNSFDQLNRYRHIMLWEESTVIADGAVTSFDLVPEPATATLLAGGLVALDLLRRCSKQGSV